MYIKLKNIEKQLLHLIRKLFNLLFSTIPSTIYKIYFRGIERRWKRKKRGRRNAVRWKERSLSQSYLKNQGNETRLDLHNIVTPLFFPSHCISLFLVLHLYFISFSVTCCPCVTPSHAFLFFSSFILAFVSQSKARVLLKK